MSYRTPPFCKPHSQLSTHRVIVVPPMFILEYYLQAFILRALSGRPTTPDGWCLALAALRALEYGEIAEELTAMAESRTQVSEESLAKFRTRLDGMENSIEETRLSIAAIERVNVRLQDDYDRVLRDNVKLRSINASLVKKLGIAPSETGSYMAALFKEFEVDQILAETARIRRWSLGDDGDEDEVD